MKKDILIAIFGLRYYRWAHRRARLDPEELIVNRVCADMDWYARRVPRTENENT